jgi:pyruvate/2-oxoglutarate/acetoin dehydrogenase E1 component
VPQTQQKNQINKTISGKRPVFYPVFLLGSRHSKKSSNSYAQQCGKNIYMSAGRVKVPIVFRGPNGLAAGVDAQHSQDYSAWYAHCPTLKVINKFKTLFFASFKGSISVQL